MGVDYYACQVCNETFPDCGEYFTCYASAEDDGESSGCDEMYCSEECGKPKTVKGKATCVKCRGEWVSDDTLLEYLLKHSKLTRAKALKMYRESLLPSPAGGAK